MNDLIKKYEARIIQLDDIYFSEISLYKSVKIKAEIDVLSQVIKDLRKIQTKTNEKNE